MTGTHGGAHESRLVRLMEATTDLIGIADSMGRPLYINQAGRRMLGLGEDADLSNRHIRDFSPTWASSVILETGIPFAMEHGSWEGDTALLNASGQEIPVSQLILAEFDDNGELEFLSTVARDIRARKAFEKQLQDALAELRSAQQQILQSEKLAAIGQLAAGVAHEINNPVGYIQSNLSTMRDYAERLDRLLSLADRLHGHLPAGDPLRDEWAHAVQDEDLSYLRTDLVELVEESLEGVARVRRIVLDLRDFSRVDAPEWAPADLHQGLESTLNVVANELKYKCTVVREYGDLPSVECLGSQINQVFLNLLVNAAHAMEEPGEIRIRTGATDDGESVWIEVEDDGVGIPPEVQTRIFEPFFTTKPPGFGTGLGLPLAYRIIQRHGGHLSVESTPGEGTCFRIELPARQNGDSTSDGDPVP